MSEWFYINTWKKNRQPEWLLIDGDGNILLRDVTVFEAHEKKEELDKPDLKVVNKFDSRYNKFIYKNEPGEENEDS